MIQKYKDGAVKNLFIDLHSRERKEYKMPQGKHIRISNRLYEHLKSLGGVMSKNLDELVFGKKDTNALTPESIDTMLEKASAPDSPMLYSAIMLCWSDHSAEITRGEIIQSIEEKFSSLNSLETRKMLLPSFYVDMHAPRSKFQTTIDNRINNLVRAGVIKRKDGKLLLTGKPNQEFIQNAWNYYAINISAYMNTRRFVQMIYSDPASTDNEAFPI